jgi:NAD(P)-dependent dehydrogenase (short-subunit alcohol dehydrogenase family)
MLDLQLNNKVALVTGAGQGVGRRIAIDLAAQGCRVGVNDLFPDRAEAVAAEIRAAGHQAIALAADICDAKVVSDMFSRLREAFGPVGILVNNAGIPPVLREPGAQRSLFADTTIEEQHAMVDLNVHGTLYCCREALMDMRESRQGRIISIVSEAGRIGEARLAIYSGAKAAIVGFTMALAREYGPLGVTANSVALGAVVHEGIKTGPLNPQGGPESEAMRAKIMKTYPAAQGLGRLGTPQDVSAAVLYLSSPLAAYVTGQSLGVSGGFHMQ